RRAAGPREIPTHAASNPCLRSRVGPNVGPGRGRAPHLAQRARPGFPHLVLLMSMHRSLRSGSRALVLLVGWACGGTDAPSSSNTPVKIVAASGGGQTADLGQPLP